MSDQKPPRITIRVTDAEHQQLKAAAPNGQIGPYLRDLALGRLQEPTHHADCLDVLDQVITRAEELLEQPNLKAIEMDKTVSALEKGRRLREAETKRLQSLTLLVDGDVVRHGLQAIQEGIIDLTGDNLGVELSGYGVPRERVERLKRELLENMRRFVAGDPEAQQ